MPLGLLELLGLVDAVTEGRKDDADGRYQRQSKRIADIGIGQSKNRRHFDGGRDAAKCR